MTILYTRLTSWAHNLLWLRGTTAYCVWTTAKLGTHFGQRLADRVLAGTLCSLCTAPFLLSSPFCHSHSWSKRGILQGPTKVCYQICNVCCVPLVVAAVAPLRLVAVSGCCCCCCHSIKYASQHVKCWQSVIELSKRNRERNKAPEIERERERERGTERQGMNQVGFRQRRL